jgi:O-acetylhomoserine/O-acetylserine sulfhydrylase-like pyridoxal-dependent enzyme
LETKLVHSGERREPRLVDLGIAESLVRISVGIADVNDIIADVERALEK